MTLEDHSLSSIPDEESTAFTGFGVVNDLISAKGILGVLQSIEFDGGLLAVMLNVFLTEAGATPNDLCGSSSSPSFPTFCREFCGSEIMFKLSAPSKSFWMQSLDPFEFVKVTTSAPEIKLDDNGINPR